jgi:AcrR family transcriptional regulator
MTVKQMHQRLETRRQRRAERRRNEILTAAARVFAEKGFASASVKEIADAADVAEGTLYNYFSSKRDLLLAIFNQTETLMEQVFLEGEGLNDRDAIVAMFEKGLSISEAQLPFTRTLLLEAWTDDETLQEFVMGQLERIHQRLAAYITQRIETGVFRPIDPALGARMALGMFAALILPALRGVAPLPAPETRRALAETVVGLLLDGIRAR